MINPKKLVWGITLALFLASGLQMARAESQPETIKGYVLDSACAFTKGLKKPISAECATACAKAGSPLVILTDNGTIYWPISDATPAQGQNDRLMEFAAKRVVVTGKVYQRAGSRAVVIATIQAEK
ncbi:MAG: hypothetical protein ABSF71_21950 [Terriglobia bacterium]|jgi:hypothetical protein